MIDKESGILNTVFWHSVAHCNNRSKRFFFNSYVLLQVEDTEQEEERQIVADVVHDFLQVLCTSHKYGIIFHDRSIGTSGKKHNELLQTVLEVNSVLINHFWYLL
jgi:hypothetical protein